ncbi:hypothetical protein PCASD_03207 [Puccinia coronata f. sp. avenae]|nr:hypothetical protein PCASD_09193 [Puccinia coronata f. sp. avenae]PLW48728.1 hypothetical protein PCASD_03207 [Puccinia coronata f. sp. avenae]
MAGRSVFDSLRWAKWAALQPRLEKPELCTDISTNMNPFRLDGDNRLSTWDSEEGKNDQTSAAPPSHSRTPARNSTHHMCLNKITDF